MDAELWPQEAFGGVSDEQFWDDLASDKPLATTARTAQPEAGSGQPRPRPGEPRPGDPRLGDPRAGGPRREGQRPGEGRPGEGRPSDRTQVFQAAGFQSAQSTGPQPRATTQPQPVQPLPQPAQPAQLTQPLRSGAPSQPVPVRGAAPPQPLPAPPVPTLPAAQHAGPATGRGRHGSREDPLTSAAYSLRSSGSVDGRSYQVSRRAAISQETQAFSIADADAAPGGYQSSSSPHGYDTPPNGYNLPPGAAHGGPASSGPADNGGTGAYPYAYSQPNQLGQARRQTDPAGPPPPPYGESYRTSDPRWGSGVTEYGRPAANGVRPDPYGERSAHQGGYPGPYDPRERDRR